jgi:Na+-driven multidrug efflux pump
MLILWISLRGRNASSFSLHVIHRQKTSYFIKTHQSTALTRQQRPLYTQSTTLHSDSSSSYSSAYKSITREFFTIGIPAFVQLTAEPLASLVDTAYLGRLGPEVLGGAGVAISAQYAVSKLYNDPLLRTTISLVANQDGQQRSSIDRKSDASSHSKDLSVAVSSALLLAFVVGFIQLFVYVILASTILQGMGCVLLLYICFFPIFSCSFSFFIFTM